MRRNASLRQNPFKASMSLFIETLWRVFGKHPESTVGPSCLQNQHFDTVQWHLTCFKSLQWEMIMKCSYDWGIVCSRLMLTARFVERGQHCGTKCTACMQMWGSIVSRWRIHSSLLLKALKPSMSILRSTFSNIFNMLRLFTWSSTEMIISEYKLSN
jgi:hypothetical protein